MSTVIPEKIAKSIKEFVYSEADRVNYLARSRTENGVFLAQLVTMPAVGGKLSQYLRKDAIRTYIKDAILNRYSKDKTEEEKPENLDVIIESMYGCDAYFVEAEPKNKISLYYVNDNKTMVIIADGTVLKWETALRKALIYIASKPFSERDDVKVSILLTLFARYQKISPSDINCIQKALSVCHAKAFIYGDG